MNKSLQTFRARLKAIHTSLRPKQDSPDELLGELFQDVQLRRVFQDSITFVDMTPAHTMRRVLKAYKEERDDPHFDLHVFVKKYFKTLINKDKYTTNPSHTPEQHIEELWKVLRRDSSYSGGSLIALPYPYVVAGGRYIAQYYWDSYFSMLGLAAGGHWDIVEGMTKNCAFLIRKLGLVPNSNRSYHSSRSQPPVFALMVRLLAQKKGKVALVRYLPYMVAEHRFWMKGHDKLRGRVANCRVVRLPDGSILNRYFDTKSNPRPEGYKEDVGTALQAPERTPSRVYVDLRAGAESGWDYSSRWLRNPSDLSSIHTTDIIPVDLNSLLAILENTIADAYTVLHQSVLAAHFRKKAARRTEALTKYCWSEQQGFFFDYDFVAGAHTEVVSGAGVFPLFANIATPEQAKLVADTLQTTLLKEGGLAASNIVSGEQWDAPNGWAPLQWAAIKGLRNYGYNTLADDIKTRWLATCDRMYKTKQKLVEKYNVVDTNQSPTNGEYPLQDGFGWTNGVYLALLHEDALH